MNNTYKIYLLRHEARDDQISFNTPLTLKGKYNAINKVSVHLETLSIKTIYCSPFIRTLQTIMPFCTTHNHKVNCEWALVESFPYKPYIPLNIKDIINPIYRSCIPYEYNDKTDVLSFDDLKSRVQRFVNSIDLSQGNVLLVTHMPVINAILSSNGHKNIEMYTHHDTGSIIELRKYQ